jgi:membrane-bound inhibitor of C-type lysozyme
VVPYQRRFAAVRIDATAGGIPQTARGLKDVKACWSLLVALTACAPAREFTWHCASGASFTIRYDDRDRAIVSANDHVYTLSSTRAASGARYRGELVEYWEHHGEATLTGVPGVHYEQCKLER